MLGPSDGKEVSRIIDDTIEGKLEGNIDAEFDGNTEGDLVRDAMAIFVGLEVIWIDDGVKETLITCRIIHPRVVSISNSHEWCG